MLYIIPMTVHVIKNLALCWLRIFSCITFFTLSAQPAFAHIEVESKSVKAVLHISPNHHATAGNPASLNLDFSNSAASFAIDKCNCTATISKDGREIHNESLIGSSALEGKINYTFPEKGTYTLVINGSPKTLGDFENFTLSYPVLVYLSSHSNSSSHFLGIHKQHVPHFVLLSGGLITFIALASRLKKPDKKSS